MRERGRDGELTRSVTALPLADYNAAVLALDDGRYADAGEVEGVAGHGV